MLLCKNFGDTSPDGTLVCPCCHMTGRFKQHSDGPAPALKAPAEKPAETAACRNCGASLPPSAEKCPSCRLPAASKKQWAQALSNNGQMHLPIAQFFN